jgi:mannose-6-phosphate isomerase-like protein (cupin superfamily)
LVKLPWFAVKILKFKPYAKLSTQQHYYRHELWVILAGRGKKEMNASRESWETIGKWSVWHIPRRTYHRFFCDIRREALILEIQWGKVVHERDIYRKNIIEG